MVFERGKMEMKYTMHMGVRHCLVPTLDHIFAISDDSATRICLKKGRELPFLASFPRANLCNKVRGSIRCRDEWQKHFSVFPEYRKIYKTYSLDRK